MVILTKRPWRYKRAFQFFCIATNLGQFPHVLLCRRPWRPDRGH